MGWELTPFSVGGFGAVALFVLLATTAYGNRNGPGERPFVALMLALAGWSFAYAVQLGFTTLPEQLLWQRLGLAVGGAVPTLWFVFALAYAGETDWLTPARKAALALDPVAFAALTLTNPVHGLVWTEATLAADGLPHVAALTLGPGYYVHIAYAYLLVLAGLALVGGVVVRASPLYTKQAGALVAAVVPPLLANVAFTLGLEWRPIPALDPTPFTFVLTGLVVSLALFQFDLLDRAPIARRQLLDEMGDGIVVLDGTGEVIEANAVAHRVLGEGLVVGDGVEAAVDGATTPEAALEHLRDSSVDAAVDGRRRTYDVQLSPITGRHGNRVGTVVAARDVTHRDADERRLKVTERVLRHNLRNDMNVVLGWAEHLEATTTGAQAEAAGRIADTATDVVGLIGKTRQLVAMGDRRGEAWTRVNVRAALTGVVDRFREEYPAATVSWECPPTATVRLPDEDSLVLAVENLVENALEHNDVPDPWVGIEVEHTGETTLVRVADDGPGIPAVERAVLEDGTETPLEHGSGVGLWVAHWSVLAAGGEVRFTERAPRGSVVTLAFPAARDGEREDDPATW